MTDVFISYARQDQPFVRQLSAALEQRGRAAWVDWEGIPPTAEWLVEIRAAIAAADTFVFVISPDALASRVCALEVEAAVAQNKRLLPLVRREAGGQPVPEALARLNWIFVREDDAFDDAVDSLVKALDTDLEHLKLHTHYLVRALDWERKAFDPSLALRGSDLVAAEHWLAHSGGKAPQPTSLHNRHVLDSRRVTTRRQRLTGAAVAAGLLVATVFGLLALQQREVKQQNEQRAVANQLAGESRLALDERDDGLQDSVMLAAEAMRRLDRLGERSLAVDQALRRGLALLTAPPTVTELDSAGSTEAGAFSPGGAHLVVATRLGQVVVADTGSGRTAGSWTLPMQPGDNLREVAVDASGQRAAVWQYSSGVGRSRLSLWDAGQGLELKACEVEGDHALGADTVLGPEGRVWIGRGLWSFDDCKPRAIWDEQTVVGALALSADGKQLAAAVRARGERQRWIEVRDLETGFETARWRVDGSIARLWWTDGDRRLAGVDVGADSFELWRVDAPGRSQTTRLDEAVLAVRGDGLVAATIARDVVVRIRSTLDGSERARLVHSGPVRSAVFSADGSVLHTLVLGKLWRWPLVRPGAEPARAGTEPRFVLSPELEARLVPKGDTLLAAAPCPDERRLALTLGKSTRGGWDARSELWAMPQAERLASFDLEDVQGAGQGGLDDRAAALLSCSADGRLLALPASDAVVVLEVDGGRLRARLPHPGVHTVAFAPGGEHVATAGRGPARVWQLAGSAEVARLLDDSDDERLSFSADGRWLLSRAGDHAQGALWRPQDLIDEACARLPRALSRETWQRLFPDVAFVVTCPALSAGSAPAPR